MSHDRKVIHEVLAWGLAGLLVAVLFLGAVFAHPLLVAAGLEVTGAPTTISPSQTASVAPVATEVELVDEAAAAGDGVMPDGAVLQSRLAKLDVAALGAEQQPATVSYVVLDAITGDVITEQGSQRLLIPASNTKVLTAAAVMSKLDANQRFPTRVLSPSPGTIVLVGGGDPLLRAEPAKGYPQAASLRELATATAAALTESGQRQVKLQFDASLFADPGWNTAWPAKYRDQVTQISALWADEGRDETRVRSQTPALQAAKIFAKQLTEAGITVTAEPTPGKGSGTELARVESPPLHVIVDQALLRSNNSFTEVLGFQLALAAGRPATFNDSVTTIRETLAEQGLWPEGTTIRDASGLSRENRVSARALADVVLRIASDPKLSILLDSLPAAGVTGTLHQRFDADLADPARGMAHAKSGTLSGVSTLAGVTVTADGRQVVFAVMINDAPNGWLNKQWADQAVGIISGCGC
ncbi:MAG: D-alanyl-D-alanine carboxypeptidase/D-alanyl-D-alanine-endopeptidase [Arachnia propionica]|nr:MAG: D-alanyl-D-alanine carboxypeptidase/D-alanyl-D-alanine-endopeptidase [Arachnia propionica]